MRRPLPRLHVLTSAAQRANDLRTNDAVLDAGAPTVQIRVKEVTDREHLEVARAIVARCWKAGALSIVNDRADLALAAGADAVHLGLSDLPIAAARELAGDRLVIGGTARDPETARRLVAEGPTTWASAPPARGPPRRGFRTRSARAPSPPCPHPTPRTSSADSSPPGSCHDHAPRRAHDRGFRLRRGAGIQADLRAFGQFGVFGTSAITAVTVQNTVGVSDVHVLPASVAAQIDAVLADLPVGAVKTGMLATAELVELVAARAAAGELPNLVVDPVLVSAHRPPVAGGERPGRLPRPAAAARDDRDAEPGGGGGARRLQRWRIAVL